MRVVLNIKMISPYYPYTTINLNMDTNKLRGFLNPNRFKTIKTGKLYP